MNGIYIVGAGGHGAVVAEIADALGYEIAGFADDNPAFVGQKVLQWNIIGGIETIPENSLVAIAIGNNAARLSIYERAIRMNWKLPILIHSRATVSRSASIGPGTVLMANAVVNARTSIGSVCILNTGCSVDHDCRLESGVHIAPGARLAGGVDVGQGSLTGIGSCVAPGMKIGSNSLIGAGSVVVKDIPDGVTAFGNPAQVRSIASKESENQIAA